MKRILSFLFTTLIFSASTALAQAQDPNIAEQENSSEALSAEISTLASTPAQLGWLQNEVTKWQKEIPLKDPYTTLVNNTGDGDASLYGTRNFRVVLTGVYYRGGANNFYLKPTPRQNTNPLPEVGLKNLCQKGFALTYYYYPTNFKTASPVVQCSAQGQANRLDYRQVTAQSPNGPATVLKEIYKRIKGQLSGPIYGHCWNGWHASGYIAAVALQQFCHWSKDESLNYWIQNTAGYNHGYYGIKDGIKNFKAIPELEISAEERQLICPSKKSQTAAN